METGRVTFMEKATVDMVVLTYGDYSGLARTLHSVAEQNRHIAALILSDDGSGIPYPPLPILDKIRDKGTKIIVRSNLENLGTVAHGNVTASLCKSDYIKFLASGDAFAAPDSLQKLVSFAENEKTAAVTALSAVCSSDLSKALYNFPNIRCAQRMNDCTVDLFCMLSVQNTVSAAATLFRREFFEKTGGYDEDYRLLEDWPTWLRMARQGDRIPVLQEVVALYAMGGISSREGNAYRAPGLHEDMLLCYRKEILPYANRFPVSARRRIQYGLDRLSRSKGLWRRYPLQYLRDFFKIVVKNIIQRDSSG